MRSLEWTTQLNREIREAITGLTGSGVANIRKLNGGRNSRAYHVAMKDGSEYAAKVYPSLEDDSRSRLETEYSALEFMWDKGLKSVPEPIAVDYVRRCALYGFVHGQNVNLTQVRPTDIDQTVEFLATLLELRRHTESSGIPLAGDHGLSFQAVRKGISNRLENLMSTGHDTPVHSDLQDFLDSICIPFLNRKWAWAIGELAAAGIPVDQERDLQTRTLSPSDFGYHNVMRCDGGKLVFLDFEYFGWDDPAKLISDFLLHPAHELPQERKGQFLSGITQTFGHDPSLIKRVEIFYPLIALKWTLLLLNEFISQHQERRRFSEGGRYDHEKSQQRQLALAKSNLEKAAIELDEFPYSD